MEKKDRVYKSNCYIAKALVSTKKYDKNAEYNIKTEILKCLKVIFSDKFNVDEKDLNYIFSPLKESCAIFEIRKIDDKDCYYINIGEDYFKKSSLSGFIATISHEYGHLYQAELERLGKSTFDSVNVDESKVALMDVWQKIGFNFRYNSSKDEYWANRFSMHMLRKWLKIAEELGLDKNVIRRKRLRTYKIDFECGLYYDINKILSNAWKKISNYLDIPEESSMFGEDMPDGMSDDEYLYETNKKNLLEFGEQTKEELEEEIRIIEEKAKRRERLKLVKTSSVKQSDEKLLLTDNYIKLLAIKLGLNQDEIAISLGESNDLFEFIYTREKNSNSPLWGYLSVSVRNMLELTTSEYEKILKKELNKILNLSNKKTAKENKKENAIEN